MKKNPVEIALWAVAAIFAARLAVTSSQHDMPIMFTVTVTLSVLITCKQGAENLLRLLAAPRTTGTDA